MVSEMLKRVKRAPSSPCSNTEGLTYSLVGGPCPRAGHRGLRTRSKSLLPQSTQAGQILSHTDGSFLHSLLIDGSSQSLNTS